MLFVGGTSAGKTKETTIPITDSRVPVGSTTFTVADAASFSVGDDIMVERYANDAWIAAIGMDVIPDCSGSCYQWSADFYVTQWLRVIRAVDGNVITVVSRPTAAVRRCVMESESKFSAFYLCRTCRSHKRSLLSTGAGASTDTRTRTVSPWWAFETSSSSPNTVEALKMKHMHGMLCEYIAVPCHSSSMAKI